MSPRTRARAHPSRIVWLEQTSEALAHLELLCGCDADLRGDATRLSNRLRALLGTYSPALGERVASRGVPAVLQQYPSGPALQEVGVELLTAALKAERIRRPEDFAQRLYAAAMAPSVSISGAQTAAGLVSELAGQLATVLTRRDTLEKEIEHSFSLCPRQRSCGVCRGLALVSGRELLLRSARSAASAQRVS